MKIGLVLPSVPAYSETFFRNKIIGLQKLGYEVVLFVNNPTPQKFDLCKVVYSPNISKKTSLVRQLFIFIVQVAFNFKKVQKLINLQKKEGYTRKENIKNLFLNAHFLNQKLDWLHFGFGTMAIGREHIAEVIQAKMAVSFRGFDLYIYPVKHPKCYDLLFTKKVKYHVLSAEMKQTLLQKNIVDENIKIITPAIDTEQFFLKKNVTPKTQNSKLKILSIARLHWIKGLDYTLEALSLVKNNGLNFTYTIIGAGVEEERLRFTAHQLGIAEHIIFAGKKNPDQVIDELRNADIYLQYSIQEGFCNAVLEAQAMGLLCIVSDADGLQENVLHNQTGWVVAKRNPELLAQKIIDVVSLSQEQKNTISTNAVERVKNNFTLANQIKIFQNFYS